MDYKAVKSLIAEGKLKEAIDQLRNHAEATENTTLLNSLIIQSNRLNTLQIEENNAILTVEEIKVERAKITSAVLHIADELKGATSSKMAVFFKKNGKYIITTILAIGLGLFAIKYFSKPSLSETEIITLSKEARTLFEAKKYNEAKEIYNRLIEVEPKNVEFLSRRGYCHKVSSANDKALADYNKVIDLEKQEHHHYSNRGNLHLELKNYQEAYDDFKTASELTQFKLPKYIYNKGCAALNLNKYQEAFNDFDKAVSLTNERIPNYINNRGMASLKLNNLDDACNDFRKVLQINQDHKLAKSNLEQHCN